MEEKRKKLLISSIFMAVYIIGIYTYVFLRGELITDSKINNISNIIELIISVFGIIYFLILSFNKKINLDNHRVGILINSIIFFIINIISGIFGFMVYSNLNSTKSKKRELPVLEDVEDNNNLKYILVFALSMLIIFYFSELTKSLLLNFLMYIVVMIMVIFLFRKRLVRDFKVFKEYFREYFSLVIKTWGKSLLMILIVTLIINIAANISTSTNQQNLTDSFYKQPFLIAFLAIIYAPVSEELLFRGIFKKLIKNKKAFIILSGFIFGIVHVIDDFQSYQELLYIFVYSILGMYLASLYYKTNNIFSNMLFHCMQNTLSILGMILLYFVK